MDKDQLIAEVARIYKELTRGGVLRITKVEAVHLWAEMPGEPPGEERFALLRGADGQTPDYPAIANAIYAREKEITRKLMADYEALAHAYERSFER